MAETQIGKVEIFGMGTQTLSWSGYVSPNLQSARVSHAREKREIKNQTGQITGVIYPDDEILEVSFDAIPQGTDANNANHGAYLPAAGVTVTVANAPNITIGGFTDALNGKFVYEGGGSINEQSDAEWTVSLPLRKYKNITLS